MMKKLLFILTLALLISAVQGADLEWTQTNSSAFPARYNHASVVFDGDIWVVGGYNGTSYLNDSWSSSDGTTWTQGNASCAFPARAGHELLSYGGKMYLIGGTNGTAGANNTYRAMHDVWESTDGSNWTLTTNNPAWKGTYTYYSEDYGLAYAGSTVGDGKMWLAGGYQYKTAAGHTTLNNKIWTSTDGSTWTETGTIPEYVYGYYSSTGWERIEMEWMSLVMVGGRFVINSDNNPILPFAGTAYSTIDEGVSWSTRTTSAYWTPRYDFGFAYHDSKLILMGGYGSTYLRDVWYSTDEGTTWNQYSDGDWTARHGHATVEMGSYIYLTGGRVPAGATGEVWRGEINATATSPYSTDGTGGYGIQYPPHDVRFVFTDTLGQPVSDATVTAVPGETTLGAWSWLKDIFGFESEVDIGGLTLTGTTGSDGTISFLMLPVIQYTVTVTEATAGINHTFTVYPKDSEYVIRIGRLPMVTDFPVYNLTAESVNASHVRLQANYSDAGNVTTGLNFYVRNATGVVYTTPITLTNGTGSAYYDVADTRGSTYRFGFNGTNTNHGNVSAYQGIDMKGSGPLVDFGWDTLWYVLISLGIMFLVGGSFGEMDVRIGGIIVGIFAGIFWYIGWLPAALGGIIYIVMFLAVIYYMRGSLKAVDA